LREVAAMIVPPRSWEVTSRMMQTTEESMSPIDGVLETCLYAADLGAAERF